MVFIKKDRKSQEIDEEYQRAKHDGVRRLLEVISKGVAYPEDHSVPPARCEYIPRSISDLEGSSEAEITYDEIQDMVSLGLVRESIYRGFVNLLFTYEGRRLHLVETNFDFDRWQSLQHVRKVLCCEKAIPAFCVCRVRTVCSEHGDRCHGSHD